MAEAWVRWPTKASTLRARLRDVPPDSSLAQEEIFGPVLSVMRAKNWTTPLTIANGTKYTASPAAFLCALLPQSSAFAREFRVGNLYINRKINRRPLVERQPFGGFKLSGVGTKAGGPNTSSNSCGRARSPRTRCGADSPRRKEAVGGDGQGGAGGI